MSVSLVAAATAVASADDPEPPVQIFTFGDHDFSTSPHPQRAIGEESYFAVYTSPGGVPSDVTVSSPDAPIVSIDAGCELDSTGKTAICHAVPADSYIDVVTVPAALGSLRLIAQQADFETEVDAVVLPESNLEMTVSAPPAVLVDSQLTYTLAIANTAAAPAPSVFLSVIIYDKPFSVVDSAGWTCKDVVNGELGSVTTSFVGRAVCARDFAGNESTKLKIAVTADTLDTIKSNFYEDYLGSDSVDPTAVTERNLDTLVVDHGKYTGDGSPIERGADDAPGRNAGLGVNVHSADQAVRDADDLDGAATTDAGGCSAGGGSGGLVVLGAVLGSLVTRRRRRR